MTIFNLLMAKALIVDIFKAIKEENSNGEQRDGIYWAYWTFSSSYWVAQKEESGRKLIELLIQILPHLLN